jgi:hypothetical protein
MNKADCKLCWNATKMEPEADEPDEVYKGWGIWLESPNGGIIAAIVRKEEQLFDSATFLDYDPLDKGSILAEAHFFIDEQEPEPTYPLLELLELLESLTHDP